MAAVDVAWLHMETARSAADIVGLLQLDGVLEERLLRQRIETRLLPRPRFRQRVRSHAAWLGGADWEDDPRFSLDSHVTYEHLPAPGGRAELEALVERLVNEPLTFEHSPWRLCLIDGARAGSLVLGRLHHCMGDGFALVDVLLSLADEHVPAPDLPAAAAARSAAAALGHRVRRLLETLPSRADVPRALRLARRAPRAFSDLFYLLGLSFDPPSALRGPLSGRRRLAWSDAIALERLRARAHECGATVNDVVMAAVGAGLRDYLAERGGAPGQLRAIVPVNLRPASQPIDVEHGNWFGLVFVELPLRESAGADRIARVKQTLDRIKGSEQPAVSLAVLALMGLLPERIDHLVENILARKASVVVSNVPGPREPFHLAGHRVRDILFWVPQPAGLSCGISILSYAGQVRVGVRSDMAVVPHPVALLRHVERALMASCDGLHGP